MRHHLKFAVIAATGLLLMGAGEIYRWKDSGGVWHYSDQPQPGAEVVKAARKPPTTAAAAPARPSVAPAPAAAAGAAATAPPVSDATAQQVRAEAAAAKEEQCKKARENYDKTVQARRMYKVDDKGNRSFLTDKEIDEARLNARANVDLACGAQ